MTREFTCIICPNSCRINVSYERTEDPASPLRIQEVSGNLCARGKGYVLQELTDPRRTISTSVAVEGGELPLASVRLTAPIPRDRIFDAMAAIRPLTVKAPVRAGTVLVHDLLGLGTDVLVTKDVAAH